QKIRDLLAEKVGSVVKKNDVALSGPFRKHFVRRFVIEGRQVASTTSATASLGFSPPTKPTGADRHVGRGTRSDGLRNASLWASCPLAVEANAGRARRRRRPSWHIGCSLPMPFACFARNAATEPRKCHHEEKRPRGHLERTFGSFGHATNKSTTCARRQLRKSLIRRPWTCRNAITGSPWLDGRQSPSSPTWTAR